MDNRRDVERALEALPSTVYDTYEKTIERIKQQHTSSLALKVLSWVVYSVRPLRLKEVQHAIAIDKLGPNDRFVPEEFLTYPNIIVNACAGMIRINESDEVALVHKTVQDYFD